MHVTEEDEDADLLTSALNDDILETLALIKNKDPAIYKSDNFFFKVVSHIHIFFWLFPDPAIYKSDNFCFKVVSPFQFCSYLGSTCFFGFLFLVFYIYV